MSDEKNVSFSTNQSDDLFGQVLNDRQPKNNQLEGKDEETASESDQVSTDDKKEDDNGTATDDGEEKSETSEKGTSASGQQKTVKLGNREFKTVEEALKEANRVIGHNANLASELFSFKDKVSELEAKLQEAMDANAKWAEWAEANVNGEKAERPDTPKLEEIVRKVLEERENQNALKTLEEQMKIEVEKLQTLSNFDETLPLLRELADKINPQTGKHFMPLEAYEYACWRLGLENELNKKEPIKPTPPAEGALKAASRPTGSLKTVPKKQDGQKRDEIDEMLADFLP